MNYNYIYHVIAFDKEGKMPSLAGSFLNKEEAINAVEKSGSHEVWELFFRYIVIEKHRLDSLGHPSICAKGESEEPLWFEWKCDEPFENTQTGKYVRCSIPEWAENTFGFI